MAAGDLERSATRSIPIGDCRCLSVCPPLGLSCQACSRRQCWSPSCAGLTPASRRAGEQSRGRQAAPAPMPLMEVRRPFSPRCGTVVFAWTQPPEEEDADGSLYRDGHPFANLHAARADLVGQGGDSTGRGDEWCGAGASRPLDTGYETRLHRGGHADMWRAAICGGRSALLSPAAIWRVPPPHRIQVVSSRRSNASFGRKRGPCLADTPARSRPRRIISTSASA